MILSAGIFRKPITAMGSFRLYISSICAVPCSSPRSGTACRLSLPRVKGGLPVNGEVECFAAGKYTTEGLTDRRVSPCGVQGAEPQQREARRAWGGSPTLYFLSVETESTKELAPHRDQSSLPQLF